jgi:hypothetical protein
VYTWTPRDLWFVLWVNHMGAKSHVRVYLSILTCDPHGLGIWFQDQVPRGSATKIIKIAKERDGQRNKGSQVLHRGNGKSRLNPGKEEVKPSMWSRSRRKSTEPEEVKPCMDEKEQEAA